MAEEDPQCGGWSRKGSEQGEQRLPRGPGGFAGVMVLCEFCTAALWALLHLLPGCCSLAIWKQALNSLKPVCLAQPILCIFGSLIKCMRDPSNHHLHFPLLLVARCSHLCQFIDETNGCCSSTQPLVLFIELLNKPNSPCPEAFFPFCRKSLNTVWLSLVE